MTRLEALKELAAKVEADTFDDVTDDQIDDAGLDDVEHLLDDAAIHGSLDAAKALHEAVLPGFFWQRQGFVMFVTDDHTGWGNGTYGRGRVDENPASAWLLAVLKALIAQEKAKEARG